MESRKRNGNLARYFRRHVAPRSSWLFMFQLRFSICKFSHVDGWKTVDRLVISIVAATYLSLSLSVSTLFVVNLVTD